MIRPEFARRIAAMEARAAELRGDDRRPDLSVLTDDEMRFLERVYQRFPATHRISWQEAAVGLDQAGRDTLRGIESKLSGADRAEPRAR